MSDGNNSDGAHVPVQVKPVKKTDENPYNVADDSPPPKVKVKIDDADTKQFLTKLISLGYFHDNVVQPTPLLQEPEGEYSAESIREAKAKLAERRGGGNATPYSREDTECCIVLRRGCSTSSGADGCITRTELVKQVAAAIDNEQFDGRVSISSLAAYMSVDESAVRVAVNQLCASSSSDYVQVGNNEIVSQHHFDKLADRVDAILESSGGRVAIAELAMNVYDMPLDICLTSLMQRISSDVEQEEKKQPQRRQLKTKARIGNLHFGDKKKKNKGGGASTTTRREIVTIEYDEERAKELSSKLMDATEPTHVADLVQELHWNDDVALQRVEAMCADGTLSGELKGDTYVPNIYSEVQRKSVDDFYSANGYVNTDLLVSLGLPIGCMGEYVKESFPDSVELSDAVINVQALIDPLEAQIQEAITAGSFLDLRTALPEALVSSEADVRRILEDLVPSRLADTAFSDGVCVICDGEALYFSKGMVRDVEKKIVSPLIETYGKKHAQEIDTALNSSKKKQSDLDEQGGIITTGAKLKKSGRRGGKKSRQQQQHGDMDEGEEKPASSKKSSGKEKRGRKGKSSASGTTDTTTISTVDDSPGVISLVEVAKRVAEEYPDLHDVQESCGPLLVEEDNDPPSWEPEDGYDGAGPIYEFCRRALYTPKFKNMCARAVKAELDKMTSTRQGISVGGRKAGAVKAASIEESFEASFADACYLVQMLAKLPRLVAAGDVVDKEKAAKLEQDFLQGCAADFVRRVTQFALFRHQIEEEIFVIECERGLSSPPTEGFVDNGLPDFATSVNMTARSFGRPFLSCNPDENGKERDPLPTLRAVLPGSIGVELARMWSYCGGACYQGGKKMNHDGTEYIRPGNLEDFLRHVEESCLTVCGLPFKQLDKKSEKNAMFARRRELTAQLENSSDAKEVLELTIMLLFQQIKSIAVAGDELVDSVLQLLCKEKKISEDVEGELLLMHEHIMSADDTEEISEDLIANIKGCGLSRDISKHTS